MAAGIGAVGSLLGGAGGFFGGIGSLGESLLGTDANVALDKTSVSSQTQKLNLDPLAVQKIIEDVLGGADGLASIFQGEQTAGIFDSSVAAQAAGDLTSKLVGEIAKLTAEQETTTSSAESARQETTKEGLFEKIGLDPTPSLSTDKGKFGAIFAPGIDTTKF